VIERRNPTVKPHMALTMRLLRVRFTVRKMMVAVAGVGLLLGGWLQIVRLRGLSHEYAGRAITARRRLNYASISSGWSHERWVANCREIDQSNRKYTRYQIGRPLSPEVARKKVAYWLPIVSKYERASRRPWLPVEPDSPVPD
jgi:hypothetical protein